MTREPQAIVFAERGPHRLRVVYTWYGIIWAQFAIGLRSWLTGYPSPVYTLGLHRSLGDTQMWLDHARKDPEALRTAIVTTTREARAAAKKWAAEMPRS